MAVAIPLSRVNAAATITVNSTADDQSNDGECTLREAITAANTDTASGAAGGECVAGSGTDTVVFSISTGQQTIQPASPLPNITTPVIIDGTTQPGEATCGTTFANRTLLIEIDGTNAGNTGNGLTLAAGSVGSTIKGLVINRSGTGHYGIALDNSNSHIIQCNFLGTNFVGTANLGSSKGGISLNTVNDSLIGGTSAGSGNLVSGNSTLTYGVGDGILTVGVNDNNIFQGNWVGLGSDGSCVGNGDGQGITISGNNNLVGGITVAARNVVSCHTTTGLGDGVDIVGLAGVTSTGNKVQGNYIGTNVNGQVQSGYGNNSGSGMVGDVNDNLIGGTGAGEGNIIAGNGAGVFNITFQALEAINNSIIGNSIYSNDGNPISSLGIDNLQSNDFVSFVNVGVTLNDADDIDYNGNNTSSNHYLNFPVINSITSANGQVTINYDLDVNDAEVGATGYRVEFFANDAADPSGYGEGQTFLGFETIAGDVSNQSVTFTLPDGADGNKFVSATTTMTDASADGFGHTSEFGVLVEADLVATEADGANAPDGILADTGQNPYLYFALATTLILTSSIYLKIRYFGR